MQSDFVSGNWDISKQVRDHSYKQIINKPDTNIQRNIIRNMLLAHPEGITDLEICVLTGFIRTSVTARRNEIENVTVIGIAKIQDENGDRLNTLWGFQNPHPLISCGTKKNEGGKNADRRKDAIG